MSGRRLRILTRLVLAVAVLLASVAPPGYRHAHIRGEVPHDHHQPNQHDVAAHDEHHHRGNHDHHHAGMAQANLAEHVHFTCWLFDLTLPVRDNSDRGFSDENGDTVYVVRLLDDCLQVTIESNPIDKVAAFDLPNSIALAPSDIDANPPSPAQLDGPILLCDAARHERTGVQLF